MFAELSQIYSQTGTELAYSLTMIGPRNVSTLVNASITLISCKHIAKFGCTLGHLGREDYSIPEAV